MTVVGVIEKANTDLPDGRKVLLSDHSREAHESHDGVKGKLVARVSNVGCNAGLALYLMAYIEQR